MAVRLALWEIRSAVLASRAALIRDTADDRSIALKPYERIVLRGVAEKLERAAAVIVSRNKA